MATPEERSRFIRFQLATLAERNGHHEFEHICRRVAGARIASNLLPATGPVSAGGDQGRDFETYPTELVTELGPHGHFLAFASDLPLAFVCTIQQTGLRAKIVADVRKVMAEGSQVGRVHAFVTGGISKSQREKAIKEVKEDFGVGLVIHDAVYLADQLAEPDLYWVARRYLDAPEEMAPAEPSLDDSGAPAWYLEDRERWRSREPNPTLGDLLDLKDGLRRATFHDHARPDLPFWLDLMRPLANRSNPRTVRQRARYEVSVAVLRGQGTLRPADSLAHEYFADLDAEQSAERLQEASTLLMYAIGAKTRGQTTLEIEDLARTGDELRAKLADLLAEEPPPNRRARLLLTLGHLSIGLDPRRVHVPAQPQTLPDMGAWIDENDDLTVEVTPATPPEEVMVDLAAGMAAWMELARALDDAPLFPVDDLASMLGVLAPILIDHPDWRELNDRLDAVLGRQAGQGAVAARCRDRAIALRRAGRIREAIGEFHRAKVDWWTGDSLRGAMLASLILSDCYEKLGLHHAALQQALAVAFVAHTSDDERVLDLLPKALGLAALSEYRTGAWLGACELTELSFMAASIHLEGGVDPDDEGFGAMLVHAGMTAAAAQVMVPCALDPIRAAQGRFQLDEFLGGDPLDPALGAPKSWEEWDTLAQNELPGPPFVDLASEFTIHFAALGTSWTVRASTDEGHAVRAAQRLAAAAEVLLVELADEDLCLIPSSIDITVAVAEAKAASTVADRAGWQPSPSGRRWKFELTPISEPTDDPEDVGSELLIVMTMVLMDASLLPFHVYQEALHRAFERGLSHKLFFGRPYDELRLIFEDPDLRASIPADCRRPDIQQEWEAPQSQELPWCNGPGPGFTDNAAVGHARARYENTGTRLPRQLQLLKDDRSFQQTVAELRGKGWHDHHILSSVMNITLNSRAQMTGIDPRDKEAMRTLIRRPETTDGPLVPVSEFPVEAMEQARRFALPAVLATWDLTLHSPTPNLDAVEKVLDERYAYWSADSPYDGDLLPPTDD